MLTTTSWRVPTLLCSKGSLQLGNKTKCFIDRLLIDYHIDSYSGAQFSEFESHLSSQKNTNWKLKEQSLFLVLTHLSHIGLLHHLFSMIPNILPISSNNICHD